MNFKITEKTLKGLGIIEIKNRSTKEYVNIIPAYGGTINEVVLNNNDKLYSIHKCAKSLQEFKEVSIPLYAGSFLAPFPNRIKNGTYEFNGMDYQLEITDLGLPNALHGFLFNVPFTILSKEEKSGTIVLEHHFQGAMGYPFPLFFRNTYRLSEGMLRIKSYVRNDSEDNIPFGMGWHPYISTGTPIDLMQLKIPAEKLIEQDKQFIPTGKILENTIFKDGKTIFDTKMNDCYKMENGKQTLIYDPEKELEIFVEQQIGKEAYNYVMYYTPPSRDCLAVEPMTAAPNAFNNGLGFIELEPSGSMELEFSIGINSTPT